MLPRNLFQDLIVNRRNGTGGNECGVVESYATRFCNLQERGVDDFVRRSEFLPEALRLDDFGGRRTALHQSGVLLRQLLRKVSILTAHNCEFRCEVNCQCFDK